MKKLAIKKAAPATVWSVLGQRFDGKPNTAEFQAVRAHVEGLDDFGVRALWNCLVDERTDLSKAPRWLMCIGIEYFALIEGLSRRMDPVSQKVRARFAMAKALNRVGLKNESAFLSNQYNESGGSTMSKGKGSERRQKERRAARITSSSVLISILSRDNVPADDKIIDEVKEKTGHSKFDAKQLAWYKWKYRQGKLKGQDGKQHVIEQGDNKKPVKSEKKKKVVLKKKAKKAVAA